SCDCKQADWTTIPKTTVTSGANVYARQVCVNLVNGAGGVPVCPGGASDTGLKNVVLRVSWGGLANSQSYEMQNVVNRKEELSPVPFNPGTFRITFCQGAPGDTNCGGQPPLPSPPRVSVYKL